jgi:hypothetical protein
MIKCTIVISILAIVLAACGGQSKAGPQSDAELMDLVQIPSGWNVEGIGDLEQTDIPADAYTGLQESFRAIISEPNQPESSTASSYLVILLYEDTAAAQDAYKQVRTHMLVDGAEVGETKGSLPNEEITFAMANHPASGAKPAASFVQTTILTCRAVVRFNWDIYHTATPTFTVDEAMNVEITSAREIRRATCQEE